MQKFNLTEEEKNLLLSAAKLLDDIWWHRAVGVGAFLDENNRLVTDTDEIKNNKKMLEKLAKAVYVD